MRRFLLDSNGVNALSNRHQPFDKHLRRALDRGDRIGTCEPVVAEMYLGLQFSSSRERSTIRLERALNELYSWPFNRRAAWEYGQIAADLKRRGKKIQIVDLMVAAIALTMENCTVVTTDSDFSYIAGLSVENWTLAVT